MTLRRWSIVMCWLLLAVAASPAAAQPGTSSIKLSVEPFFDGNYRAGSWLPLRVSVANDGADVIARVRVDTGHIWQTEVDLPRGADKTLVLYTQINSGFRRTVPVRVFVGDAEVTKIDVPLNGTTAAVQMIGTLSAQPLTLPDPLDDKGPSQARLIALGRDDLPERGEGLSMFGTLIVDGAPLADLSAAQEQALVDWVSTGGRLVIGGDQLGTTLGQLPEVLRVATPGDATTPAPISLLPELNDAAIDAVSVIGGDAARTIATSGAATVGVQQGIGSGSVTVLGWSLSDPHLGTLPGGAALWKTIAEFQTAPAMVGMPPTEDMQAQGLAFALTQLPVLAMPPLGVLAGLLAVYLLIVGPGMYLLLRRFDRQAWAWIAIPAVTIVFSLGAYGYGLSLRGNDIVLNQISIVEGSGDRSRVRTFAGLFSPRTATYRVVGSENALFKPMSGGEAGPLPAAGSGGVYTQGNNSVDDLQVAQWSMNTFAAEQMQNGAPLQASLTLKNDKLEGTIRNTGTQPVRDVALLQNVRAAMIGDLQPGESRDVSLDLGPNASVEWGGSVSMLLLRDKWDFANTAQPPTEIRQRLMVLDALFNSPYDRQTAPMLIGWMDRAPIELSLSAGRVQSEQVTLVMSQVESTIATDGVVTLPRGWITSQFEAASSNPGMGGGPCMTQYGSGWYLDAGVVTSTLQLPPVAHGLEITKATMFLQHDGPGGVKPTLSMYDWDQAAWIEQRPENMMVELEQPQRFINEAGVLQARVEIEGEPGQGGGCISTDVSLEGTRS